MDASKRSNIPNGKLSKRGISFHLGMWCPQSCSNAPHPVLRKCLETWKPRKFKESCWLSYLISPWSSSNPSPPPTAPTSPSPSPSSPLPWSRSPPSPTSPVLTWVSASVLPQPSPRSRSALHSWSPLSPPSPGSQSQFLQQPQARLSCHPLRKRKVETCGLSLLKRWYDDFGHHIGKLPKITIIFWPIKNALKRA